MELNFWELGEIYRDGNCLACGGEREERYNTHFCKACGTLDGETEQEIRSRWNDTERNGTSWLRSLDPLPEPYKHMQSQVDEFRYHVRNTPPGSGSSSDQYFNFCCLASLEILGAVGTGQQCPRCEQNKSPREFVNDYVCRECRYGV